LRREMVDDLLSKIDVGGYGSRPRAQLRTRADRHSGFPNHLMSDS
jgi:hypothetical protein